MNLWIILGLLITAFFYGEYKEHEGKIIGQTEVEAQWQAREAQINGAAAAKLQTLEENARATEQANQKQIAGIDAQFQTQLKETNEKKDRAVAALAAGRKLFSHAQCPTAPKASGSVLPGPSASPGSGNDPQRVELPAKDSQFLLGLGAEADTIADQLRACQAIVIIDREGKRP